MGQDVSACLGLPDRVVRQGSQVMSDSIISPIIEAGAALSIAIGGWFMNGQRKRLEKIEDDQEADHNDLADFKLLAANTYAREASLTRIHDRLDETAKVQDIVELRNDIKSLMAQNGKRI